MAIGLIAPLFVGPLIGVLAGLVVTKAHIPSFIVTLGTLMMARSLTLVVTQGQPIPDMPEALQAFGQGRLGEAAAAGLLQPLCRQRLARPI